MAKSDLRRVEECRRAWEAAREKFEVSILRAVESGETYRDVAESAELSYQRIAQIVQERRYGPQV